MLDSLPQSLQPLLNGLMRTCHVTCCDNTETANSFTRELHDLLQQLVAAIDSELQSNPGCFVPSSSYAWRLLGRLAEGINRHFQIRPRIAFSSHDAAMQSAAAAARGIRECFLRVIQLLSPEEDHAGNIAAFSLSLMDTDSSAETCMRFAFLDAISRRVVAVKRPDQIWHVTIDGEIKHACTDSGAASGFDELPAPFRKDDFEVLTCPICTDTLFQNESDGSIVLLARQLKCPTVVDVTTQNPTGHEFPHVVCEGCAQRNFVQLNHTACPQCRHSFDSYLCVSIAAALQHQVHGNGHVQWTSTPECRLAALNVLTRISAETPLSDVVSFALLWSCLDPAAGIAHAALCCGRLAASIQVMPQAQASMWRAKLVHAFTITEAVGGDSMRGCIARAIGEIIEDDDSCASFIAAGACGALVDALGIAETDDTRGSIALSIFNLAQNEEGRSALIAAGACGALVDALGIATTDDTRGNIALALQAAEHPPLL